MSTLRFRLAFLSGESVPALLAGKCLADKAGQSFSLAFFMDLPVAIVEAGEVVIVLAVPEHIEVSKAEAWAPSTRGNTISDTSEPTKIADEVSCV